MEVTEDTIWNRSFTRMTYTDILTDLPVICVEKKSIEEDSRKFFFPLNSVKGAFPVSRYGKESRS